MSLDRYLENMFNYQCGIYDDDWPDEDYQPDRDYEQWIDRYNDYAIIKAKENEICQ